MRPRTYRVIFTDGQHQTSYQTHSRILRPSAFHPLNAPHIVSSGVADTFGPPTAPLCIRIGNGGLGPTGLLRVLCLAYIARRARTRSNSPVLRIEWVCNHSRHTQVALQAGVVDIALTYEREEERTAEEEGWSRAVGVLCHDHFVIAGPREDPAGLGGLDNARHDSEDCSDGEGPERKSLKALRAIASTSSTFHTRSDGSATTYREHLLWSLSRISPFTQPWYTPYPATQLGALLRADEEGAYLLTDRATYLTATQAGRVKNMRVYVEGGAELLNTCCICVGAGEEREEVLKLVDWLQGEEAQALIERYGRDWKAGVPIVTPASRTECQSEDQIRGGLLPSTLPQSDEFESPYTDRVRLAGSEATVQIKLRGETGHVEMVTVPAVGAL